MTDKRKRSPEENLSKPHPESSLPRKRPGVGRYLIILFAAALLLLLLAYLMQEREAALLPPQSPSAASFAVSHETGTECFM